MPAISVGSVEVDVIPNATGIRQRMQRAVVPAADSVGNELGRVLGHHVMSGIAAGVVDGLTRGGRQAQAPAARQGTQTGSTFARGFKTRVEAALRDLPEVRLTANSTDAEREIYNIRRQLAGLRDARIGIDVSEADAVAAMDHLRERLARLSASSASVAVRVDAGAASAQLAAFQAEVNRLDGQSVDVDVDTHAATANLGGLVAAAIALGPAILPVLPVIAAGLGAVAAAATAAGVGVGGIALVAVPAFKQIATVLQAQKQAQDAATNSSLRGSQAGSQAAQRALQQASAQQALATAQRNAARQIADAERGVSDAQRQAAQANAQASQQMKAARQSLADAYQQAADRMEQANRQVTSAERDLAQAQNAAKQAQLDLSAARKEAVTQLEDLNNRLTDAQLSQRDAEIQLKEAAAQRDAVLKNANATELDKQKALLAYDQAVQRLKEQTTETKRLRDETKAANQAGVDGSDTVKSAQERLAQAQQDVTDKTRALKDAQANVTKTQIQNTRAITDAQEKLSVAQKNVAETQRQGAESIARAQERVVQAQQSAADSVASAQRQIASASLSAAGGVDQAAIAQAKYRAELAKLTPAGRATMNAFLGLKSAFGAWSRSLQPAVMPIFTRALVGLRNTLPTLTPFVTAAADAIKGLQDRASSNLKKPFWQGFKKDLQGSVKPAITGLGVAFGNVITGMAGIIDAFLPHMDGISGRIQTITGRFASWGKGLKGSPEFERFLAYSSEHAPLLADALGKIASAFLSIGVALAPVSGPLLQVIGGLAQGVGWLATNAPELVVAIYGLFLATKLWALWQVLVNGAMTAFNLIMSAGPWGWIVLAIVGVSLAIMELWKHCAWFRDAIKGAWSAIKGAAQDVIDWFAGPFVRFFTQTIPNTFHSVINWVRKNWPWLLTALTGPIGTAAVAIYQHWGDIKKSFSDAWSSIKKYTIYPIRDFFTKTIPGWGNTLSNKMIEAFDAARKGIKATWDKIKKIAREPVQYVVDVVYNNGIRKVWNLVAKAFGADQLKEYKFASGGIMPGYTPGRDVHRFVSPTGGALELSGGEAIMRPEFTRAVGSGFVNTMNAIAKSRGSQGVKSALAPVFGGNPPTPTDTSLRYAGGGVVQRFADGGIFDWIQSAGAKVAGVGSAAWNKIKKGASWLSDTLEASARAGVTNVVDPLLKNFPGMDTGFGQMIRRIPTNIIDALFGYSKKADDKGAGAIGGPRIAAALKWAKTQAGKPYQWAGNGNPSWDCSGFMSAIESVIRGQKPHRRWATMAFSGKTAPPGWVYHSNSPFRIGITNAGVGHTAGTLGKTNVESRGGDGVIVGKRARGYTDRLFGSWYGFQPGKYDTGGWMPPGMNLMYNGLGQPEAVLTPGQWSAIQGAAARGADGPQQPVVVELHAREGALGQFIDVRIQDHQQQLVQVLNAN